jgi:hypothetical protein
MVTKKETDVPQIQPQWNVRRVEREAERGLCPGDPSHEVGHRPWPQAASASRMRHDGLELQWCKGAATSASCVTVISLRQVFRAVKPTSKTLANYLWQTSISQRISYSPQITS